MFELLRLFTVEVVARTFVFQWRSRNLCITVFFSFTLKKNDKSVEI